MSDKIDREIEEILDRFDESGPEEDMLDRTRGLFYVIARHRMVLASLVLVVLVAAGLFFGLAYPSLSSSGSTDEEIRQESAGDQIGEGAHVDEAWPEGSGDEAADTEEGEHGADHTSQEHDEHHREGGEQH